MGKLISYEFRNSRKPIMQIVLIIMLASVLLQYGLISTFVSVGNMDEVSRTGLNLLQQVKLVLLPLLIIASIIVFFGASVVYYFRMANILKRDIYENQGYIIFSLPKNGYQIIGSKLIVGTIWSILLSVIMIAWNAAVFMILSLIFKGDNSLNEFYKFIFSDFPKLISEIFSWLSIEFLLSWFVNTILSSISFIVIMFAAIIFDYRLGTRNKSSIRWIIWMILLSILIGWASSIIFPSNLGLGAYESTALGLSGSESILSELFNIKELSYHVWMENLFTAVVSALLFIYVAHNFEKKIEK